MCFCFLCLVCPVLQVYLDCLPLVFSNVYLVHLCSLFNGQLTNSSFLWILFVLSYLTCSRFIWLFTLLVILSYLPFLVLSYLPFLILSYIPFFGIELSPIFGIELSSILWYWVISHFLVLSYLQYFGIELSPNFGMELFGSTADQTLCVILFIDTSKKKYTNTISFTDKTCAISDIDNINMIPDQHIIFLDMY